MKDFMEFRDKVLAPEVLQEIKQKSQNVADAVNPLSEHNWMATFSATFSLLLLDEYHEWLHQE